MVLYLPPLRESEDREAWILVTRSLCRSISHPFLIFTADVGSLDSAFSSLKMRCLSGFLKGFFGIQKDGVGARHSEARLCVRSSWDRKERGWERTNIGQETSELFSSGKGFPSWGAKVWGTHEGKTES